MNGSTNGVVGFNFEEARDAAERLDCSFTQLSNDVLDGAMGNLSMLIFDSFGKTPNSTRYANAEKLGWYAPEAVEFEKNVFIPFYENLYKNIYNIYITPFNRIVEATKKWCQTTGMGNVNLLSYGYQTDEYGLINKCSPHSNSFYKAKATDNDGNISISPNLPSEIGREKARFLNEIYPSWHGNLVRLLRGTRAFIGSSQESMLIAMVEGMCRRVEKEVAGLYDTAAREVQKSIEKYQAIAKQVASSFNN